jgi:hypothetical protein
MLTALVAVAAVATVVGSNASGGVAASHWRLGTGPSLEGTAASKPRPLDGVPLTGSTGLRILIANTPPVLLDVDSGELTTIGGLVVGGLTYVSVHAVGKDAIVWLARDPRPWKTPRAEIYVVRHDAPRATRIATAWEVAASSEHAVWLKSYRDARHCTLREVSLEGRRLSGPRAVRCSTRLVDAGGGALLVQGSSVLDPRTHRIFLARAGRFWARAGDSVLTVAGSQGPLTLTNVRSGERTRFRYPSDIGGQGGAGDAAVQRKKGLVALEFGDPAYEFSGTQVIDLWLLDTRSRRLHHVPDMPAAVSLKRTSMSWTRDGRLVLLAESAGRDLVAVWRPGQKRIGVRPVRLPRRSGGSDSFVVWP